MIRPTKLKDIVGQAKAKEVLQTLIRSSNKTGDILPHILISAPPGSGKTTIAKALANEVNTKCYEVNCSTISTQKQLFNIITQLDEGSIFFADEIHALNKRCTESLYSIMEDFCYYDKGQKEEIEKITVIGASTEIGALPLPLVGRFKFKATLEPYTEDEIVQVCRMVCESKGFKLNDKASRVIAKTTRSNPREMVKRAEWIYQYMTGNEIETVDIKKVLDIIALQGINKDGLEQQDINYLKLLKQENGLSLNALSSKLLIDKEDIRKLIEPYLLRLGFISISAGVGRILTKEGKKYVQNLL